MKTRKIILLTALLSSAAGFVRAGADFSATFDVTSGYLLYGALMNEEPCLQYGAQVGWTEDAWGRLGVGWWGNSDLTDARPTFREAFNENDFYLVYSNAYAFDDRGEWSLAAQVMHMWYWYPRSGAPDDQGCPAKCEFYFTLALENPFVTPYAMYTHEYRLVGASYWELGLRRRFALTDSLSVTPMVSVNFLDDGYMTIFPAAPDGETVPGGLGCLRPGVMAEYAITEYFSLRARVDVVTILNDDLRDAVDACPDNYRSDFVWASLGFTLRF